MLLRIILVSFSCLLLGAHFLRGGNFVLTLLCLSLPFLLVIKKRWSLAVVQISLFIGAWIWVRSIVIILHTRITNGLPWARVVTILGAVAMLTLCSGLLLFAPAVKKRYPRCNQGIENCEHDPEGGEQVR
ncbi:MAG: hypothetical protein ACMUIS_05025 [bacterium]